MFFFTFQVPSQVGVSIALQRVVRATSQSTLSWNHHLHPNFVAVTSGDQRSGVVLSGTCAHATATLESLSGLRPCGPSYVVKGVELAGKREVTVLSGKQRENCVHVMLSFVYLLF